MASTSASTRGNNGQQMLIIAVSVVLTLVTLVGISLRIYARLAVLKKVFTDDVLMLFGTITAFGLSATFTIAAYHGYGSNDSQILEDNREALGRIAFATVFLYIVTQLLVKTSFLVLYLRLDQRVPMRATVYILMFVVAAQNITFFIIQALSCIPIGSIGSSNCWSADRIQLLFNVVGIIIIIIDGAIFVIPLCMLHGLELPPRQKIAVGALFALAFLPIAAGCLRSFFGWDAISSPNSPQDLVLSGIFAQLEIHLAILCGSASTFKVLLKGFWPWRWWCQNNDDTPSHSRQQSVAVELPTPWPTEQHKFVDVSFSEESPISTDGSWRTWAAPLPPPVVVKEEQRSRSNSKTSSSKESGTTTTPRLSIPKPVMKIIQKKKKETANEVARLPADLRLRFPSIESRLEGRHAWMEAAEQMKEKDKEGKQQGQRWSLIHTNRSLDNYL